MRKTALIILGVATALGVRAEYALLPQPQSISVGDKIVEAQPLALNVSIVDSIPGSPAGNDEAYSISVTDSTLNISAISSKGVLWANKTLNQLLEDGKLPVCEIVDWPAFPWRGFMMDTGRSYISMEELKREIDFMSDIKMNVFHWHLTENQAWRLESKLYPELNDSVNMIRDHGKFYTFDEARALIEYARRRGVTVVPELDMPGHSAAFVRTFGVDMQSPEGMEILKNLVSEACRELAVPYLHIGTDEVKFTNPDFCREMADYVHSCGKKVITWYPGYKYNPGEIDLTHMWSYRGEPTQGIPAVDVRFHYINHFDNYADLRALFRSNVYGHRQAEDGIVGVEIGLWNDRAIDDEASLIAQNGLYPALMAVAERSWRGGGNEYFDRLGVNLNEADTADFEAFADFERRLLWQKEHRLSDLDIPYHKESHIRWLVTDAFPNNGDMDAVFPPETEEFKSTYIYNDSIYNTHAANGATVYLRHVWGPLIPALYPDPKPNHTAYAFTRIYAPEDMTAHLQAETQNYSRSESDVPPPQGKWDFRGSRIWINGEELPAPQWTATHTERSNEIPLGNENLAAREPIPVKLHKGWNTVLLKLPVGEFRTPEVRLVKWMFTFSFLEPELLYQPL